MNRLRDLFGDPDGEILKHAQRIKLELEVGPTGELWCEFQICGGVSHFPDEQDAAPVEKADAAELAGDLLGKFLAAKGGPR